MKTKTYNPYLDIVKFILANMVVCIHFVLPGQFGEAVDCIARVAVPFFFMVSGFYSFNCDNRILWRRFLRNTVLLVSITLVYALWGVWKTKFILNEGIKNFLSEKLNVATGTDFVLYSINPFSNHLWFIETLAITYLVFLIFNLVIKNKSIMNTVLIVLMTISLFAHIWMGSIVSMIMTEPVPKQYYRNAWLFGIPMFLLGYTISLVMNKWNTRTIKMRIILTMILVFGIVAGLFQWFTFGKAEMPIGMLLVAVSLIMLVLDLPEPNTDSKRYVKLVAIAKTLGKTSVWIYVIHKLIGEIIESYAPYNAFCGYIYNGYRFPLVVMAISTGISIAIVLIVRIIKDKVQVKT